MNHRVATSTRMILTRVQAMTDQPPSRLWHRTILGTYLAVNLVMVATLRIGPGDPTDPFSQHPDWRLWSALPAAIAEGRLHSPDHELPFVWSPVAGWLMALVPQLGYWPWLALHVAVVFLLRDRLLVVLTLASWGFWVDAVQANTFGFVFVSGLMALRGSRTGALVYLALLFLMPRPVQVPLALWLLWTRPELRLPAAAIFIAHGMLVLGSGYAGDWVMAALSHRPDAGNYGPTALYGLPWLVVGIPLGALLLWRGKTGWAGLAWSNYWLPAYLLMPLIDFSAGRRYAGSQSSHRLASSEAALGASMRAEGQ